MFPNDKKTIFLLGKDQLSSKCSPELAERSLDRPARIFSIRTEFFTRRPKNLETLKFVYLPQDYLFPCSLCSCLKNMSEICFAASLKFISQCPQTEI